MFDQGSLPAGAAPSHRVPLPQSIIQPFALYTAAETAWYLSIGKQTLDAWRDEGREPRVTRLCEGGRPYYLGRHILAAEARRR